MTTSTLVHARRPSRLSLPKAFVVLPIVALAAACTSSPELAPQASSPAPSASATPSPTPEPLTFEVDRVIDDIEYLAEEIGPRHATSEAFAEAVEWVDERFVELGYEVEQQDVDAPAGNTWGVDVEAGTSTNVIATPEGFDPEQPHRVVGGHLDTIPVAPGAEDNASGVAAMLELARLHTDADDPVVFIAFGAEEPRGSGDDLHHFGSQQYAGALSDADKDATTAMVSLDRVGVEGPQVPICHGGLGPEDVRDQLEDAAEAADVEHEVCGDNRTSDHWSFERAGLAAARLGSLPYDGYHSPQDTPDVISEGQLERVGRIMTAWLKGGA